MALFIETLKREFFSKKSILIIVCYIFIAYFIGKYGTILSTVISENGRLVLVDVLLVIYALLGYLFSSVLFSGLIAEEIELQTMRFLTPYLSRRRIYLEKYLASICYFFILTIISIIILFTVYGKVDLPIYSILSILGFYLYTQSLVMLVSTISSTQRISTIISLTLSILFPIVYSLSLLKKWTILIGLRWLFPYHYLSKTWEITVLYFLAFSILLLGIEIFKRKEI